MLFQRLLSTLKFSARNYHVSLIGTTKEVGQTVGLLLRTQPNITKLTVYDTPKENSGIALDLSHIPSNATLLGYSGNDTFDKAIKNADVIIATGGSNRKPGTSEKTCFECNSEFIKEFAMGIAKMSPMPFVGIAIEPINIIVPMAAEIMRNHGKYDPKKLFGITTTDSLKAQSIYASENRINPNSCCIPVICGHSAKTMLPLVSQAKPVFEMDEKQVQEFTNKVRCSEEAIIKAKKGWSPTLSVAYGIFVFTNKILSALEGRTSQINAYVENNDFGTSFFSGLVYVDQNGAGEMQTYTNLSKYECDLLEKSIEELRKEVMIGKKTLEYA